MLPTPTTPLKSVEPSSRFDRLDAVRGMAVLWMATFHLCFDLNYFGHLQPYQRFLSDPFWTRQRTAIVSLFLLCAGVGQAVAWATRQPWRRFWVRWAQVVGCAALVSVGSALAFPASWISFGVLHGLALMLLLTRLLLGSADRRPAEDAQLRVAGRGLILLLAGGSVLALALPRLWQDPAFDGRWLNWTGLVSKLPITEDYVPLFPWIGVLLGGVAFGLVLLRYRPGWLSGGLPRPMQPLATLGRWSLSFYMLHQPVFIGALMAWQYGQAR